VGKRDREPHPIRAKRGEGGATLDPVEGDEGGKEGENVSMRGETTFSDENAVPMGDW